MLGQTTAGLGVDAGTFVQYGALGVIALLALAAVRVLFQREVRANDLERQRADRLEEELRRLNNTIQDRYITTLTEASRVMSEVLDYLRRENSR
jgi:DNA integrity scanning protein DisA with diadenylate cyclase activity